jgi:hypothetical protein
MLVLAAATLGACGFEVDYATGFRCIDTDDCPGGQTCVANTCQLDAPGGDDDAGALDAASMADGPDPDAAPTNLFVDPGFELANETDWNRFNSTITKIGDDPHGGTSAGRLCEISPDNAYTVFQTVETDPAQGEHFRASVFVRSASDEPVTMKMTVREYDAGSGWQDDDSEPRVIEGDWIELTVEGTIDATGREEAQVIIWAYTSGSPCFEADDAFAYRVGS